MSEYAYKTTVIYGTHYSPHFGARAEIRRASPIRRAAILQPSRGCFEVRRNPQPSRGCFEVPLTSPRQPSRGCFEVRRNDLI